MPQLLIGDKEFLNQLKKNINQPFDGIETLWAKYNSAEFKNKNSIQRNQEINDTLIKLIQESKSSFCLGAVVNYLAYVSDKKFLEGDYNLTAFERYLNQDSKLTAEEKFFIRAKIVGKYITKESYQTFFPISQKYYGTHTITAHNPPDLDSTTASFVSWLDAFGCHISESLTVWNIPRGKPSKLICSFFDQIFNDDYFKRVAKSRSFISTVAMDIVTKQNLHLAKLSENIRDLSHKKHDKCIVAVDENNYYKGDWRLSDIDAVGSIQRYLNIWFGLYEKEFIKLLFSLFIKEKVSYEQIYNTIQQLLNQKVIEIFDKHYDKTEKKYLNKYLTRIFKLEQGNQTPIINFFHKLDSKIVKTQFKTFISQVQNLLNKEHYKNNNMILSRSEIFQKLQLSYQTLIKSSRKFRAYTETLEVALEIKEKILNKYPRFVTTKSLLSEIKNVITDTQYSHITVNYIDTNDKLIPVGVIERAILYRDYLSVVSLRDFANTDEIKIGADIQVISAIDHHRLELSSSSVATIKIEDVQSCNVLLAQESFSINDNFAFENRSLKQIQQELKQLETCTNQELKTRLQLRLLAEKQVHSSKSPYFINSTRVLTEYLLFLNAIIDDTDLLIKAKIKDLKTICQLLNRIKSIQENKTLEIINLPNHLNLEEAKKLILQNEDMYSFYKNIYQIREQATNDVIKLAKTQETPIYFDDRKIQKTCCSVSQFKLFCNNWKNYLTYRDTLINKWLQINKSTHFKTPVVEFFLHMNSTVCSYLEASQNKFIPDNGNQDEIWLSISPNSDNSPARLRQFVKQIFSIHKDINLKLYIEGPKNCPFKEKFLHIVQGNTSSLVENPNIKESIILLTFNQAGLNSRKKDITPYLPR